MRCTAGALLAFLLACPADGTESEWRVLFSEPSLGERALSVRLEILEGGCDGTTVIFETEVDRDAPMPAMPPLLEDGRYGFRGTARDLSCTEYAVDCAEAEFPGDAGTITLELAPIMERLLCSGDACVDGECGPCTEGRMDCDGDESNGCEVDVRSSTLHCGACDAACERPNATSTCADSACMLGGCNDGFADCDGDPENGCESELAIDALHCGSCDRACMGGALCNDSSCSVLDCDPGTADCDEDPDNGCEVDTTSDAANCGTCGRTCGIGGVCAESRCDDELVEIVEPYLGAFVQTYGILSSGSAVIFPSLGGGGRAFRPLGIDDAVALSSGASFRCVLRESGAAECDDFFSTPTSKRTLGGNIASVPSHRSDRVTSTDFCAVLDDGDVACWALAAGDPVVTVAGGAYTQLETGTFSCGIKGGGSVECWDAWHPALCEDPPPDSAPMILTIFGPTERLTVAEENICAVGLGGTLLCSGTNVDGRVGNRRTSACEMPAEVIPLEGVRDVDIQVTGMNSGTCAVDGEGSLWCWGELAALLPGGQSDSPVRIGGINNAATVDLANGCACTVGTDGIFTCRGECFGGTTVQQSARGGVEIALGDTHSCARRANGRIACWGLNVEGQLGDGTFRDRTTPALTEPMTDASQVVAGTRHNCALSGGEVYCWGDNTRAQLGNGAGPNVNEPTLVVGLSDIVELVAGDNHTCARRQTAEVLCWGANDEGQVDPSESEPTVLAPSAVLASANRIAAGGNSTCFLVSGTTTCQGTAAGLTFSGGVQTLVTHGRSLCFIASNQLNCVGTFPDPATGAPMTSPGSFRIVTPSASAVVDVAVGADHMCAVLVDGSVYCWGSNTVGQLGTDAPSPAAATLLDTVPGVTHVAIGDEHTCVRNLQGEVICWGAGTFGQLGDGLTPDRSLPVEAVEFR